MRHNNRWTEEDTERLREHVRKGGSPERASVIFKRTVTAIRSHACSKGIKFETVRERRERLFGPSAFPGARRPYNQ